VINLGQIKDNWDLSVLRSTSVCRYLTEVEKVDPHRLTATGKSEFQPIDPANTAEARTKNRRIEIILSPKLDELYNLIKQ
jgi:chemotaxis protein MotB